MNQDNIFPPRKAMAAVATEPNVVAWQEVSVPAPGDEDVVVRVQHSWISNGTEGSFIRGERIQGDTPRGPGDPLPFPEITGYQKCGTVEWVGSAVEGLAIGDEVFVSVSRVEGLFFAFGGHISPSVSHESQVWKLPPGVSMLAASGLVLTQVGYNCGMRPSVRPGDAAVVIGDGLVGHWAAQTLRARGAHIALVGRHVERLSRFEVQSGDVLIRESEVTADVIGAWAPGAVAIVVDTVGSVPAIESMYPHMAHNGHIVSAGFYGPHGAIDIQKLRARELTLHAPAGWTRERMDATLQMLARGELQTETLITHRFPASECAAAFELVLKRGEPVLGVVLDWE